MMKLEQVRTFCTPKAWTLKQTSNRAARPHFPHTVKYVGPLNLEPSPPAWFLSQRCVQVHITCTYNTRLARTCRASRPFPTCALTRVHTQYTRAKDKPFCTVDQWMDHSQSAVSRTSLSTACRMLQESVSSTMLSTECLNAEPFTWGPQCLPCVESSNVLLHEVLTKGSGQPWME